MASRHAGMVSLALVLVIATVCNQAKGQSTCSNSLMGLAPCLSYVTGNSSTPSPACCSQLSAIVQNAPVCLCSFMNGSGNSMGLAINQTLALALPQICNVPTPPVNSCNAVANGPASSPAALPSPAPAASQDSPAADAAPNPKTESPIPATTIPSVPSGGASKTVPTTTGTSDGSLRKPALFVFLVALASILASF